MFKNALAVIFALGAVFNFAHVAKAQGPCPSTCKLSSQCVALGRAPATHNGQACVKIGVGNGCEPCDCTGTNNAQPTPAPFGSNGSDQTRIGGTVYQATPTGRYFQIKGGLQQYSVDWKPGNVNLIDVEWRGMNGCYRWSDSSGWSGSTSDQGSYTFRFDSSGTRMYSIQCGQENYSVSISLNYSSGVPAPTPTTAPFTGVDPNVVPLPKLEPIHADSFCEFMKGLERQGLGVAPWWCN